MDTFHFVSFNKLDMTSKGVGWGGKWNRKEYRGMYVHSNFKRHSFTSPSLISTWFVYCFSFGKT